MHSCNAFLMFMQRCCWMPSAAILGGNTVAVKFFRSDVSPDGRYCTADGVQRGAAGGGISATGRGTVYCCACGVLVPLYWYSETAHALTHSVFSSCRTAEEVAIACALDHPHLTRVEAVLRDGSGAVSALVMKVCLGKPMAEKPTSAHLLRCK